MKLVISSIILFLFYAESFAQCQSPVFSYKDTSFVVGATVTRRNISFSDPCQAKLSPNSKKALDSIYRFLVKNPQMKIEVGVHAGRPCYKCGSCANPTQNGADAIKDYLVKKGIEKRRIAATGYGQTMPVSQLSTGAKTSVIDEKLNTRIEFKITYNKL